MLGEPWEGLLLTLSWGCFLSLPGVRQVASKAQRLQSSLCNQTPGFEVQLCSFLGHLGNVLTSPHPPPQGLVSLSVMQFIGVPIP